MSGFSIPGGTGGAAGPSTSQSGTVTVGGLTKGTSTIALVAIAAVVAIGLFLFRPRPPRGRA